MYVLYTMALLLSLKRGVPLSTQEQLAVTYDVSNDFFHLWLDKRMNYSCALFYNEDETLEEAQANKLLWFYKATKLTAESRVLDIGCGWGGNLEFLAKDMGLRDVSGITLSEAQYQELKAKAIPGATIHCISYADYTPEKKFDALISIGMFEHLATPEQARGEASMGIYRDYFRKAWEWTKTGSWFGLQTVIGLRIPRNKKALEDLAWGTYTIFPGAITPRLETIAAAVNPYWEIVELRTRRDHYRRTTVEWLKRLRANEKTIRQRWGDQVFEDYQRYLAGCATTFAEGYQSLAQFALKRVD